MVFAWDEHKNLINRRKHGISFETAVYVFADPDAMSYVERDVDGENRWHTIGLAGTSLLILLVAHTVKEKDEEEEIRIISARKATPRERDLYCPAQ